MRKLLSILILHLFTLTPAKCQDFIFKWNFQPSLSKPYTVKIEKRNADCYIMIKGKFSLDSVIAAISEEDCDFLIHVLDNYDFPNNTIKYYGTKARKYYDTKSLPNTNWIMINGDSIKLEQIKTLGYEFDQELSQYYIETERQIIRTDGHGYSGEYTELNIKKTFLIDDSCVSYNDYELNKMIYNLITKYDNKNKYKHLKKTIESDEITDN